MDMRHVDYIAFVCVIVPELKYYCLTDHLYDDRKARSRHLVKDTSFTVYVLNTYK